MSVEARKWAWALGQLGFAVRWIAGAGNGLDVCLPGLAIDASVAPPSPDDIRAAVAGSDVVIVENLLSLPLNPAALDAVAAALRGVPTVVHHHDLPWQRSEFGRRWPAPPHDDAWTHVTINELSRAELAQRGIDSVRMYNRFRRPAATGAAIPAMDRPVLLHPTRAIPRKNVPAAVALAGDLGGTYWLLGPAEDGYGPTLERVLASARCPVVRDVAVPVGDAYAACDLVVYPSLWEGFGNPTIESALARRPLAMWPYPVMRELLRFGFRWFEATEVGTIRRFLAEPDESVLDHNEAIAIEHFALDDLPAELNRVLERVVR